MTPHLATDIGEDSKPDNFAVILVAMGIILLILLIWYGREFGTCSMLYNLTPNIEECAWQHSIGGLFP